MGRAVLEARPDGRRDLVRGTQQAPPPRRPGAVRARQPGRGVHRRRPALRPDRGHRARGSDDVTRWPTFNALPEAEAPRAAAPTLPRRPALGRRRARRPAVRRLGALQAVATRRRASSTTTSSRRRWPGTRGSASGPAPATTRRSRRREQAGVDRADADVADRLAAGNRAYEERFDRVFLIRAAGRDAPRDPGRARAAARQRRRDRARRDRDQLREIALLRLEQVVS